MDDRGSIPRHGFRVAPVTANCIMTDLPDFDDYGSTPDEDGEDSELTQPYYIGDPVMDAAQGRPMIVVHAPLESVSEWSDTNNYDLLSNYANAKFDPSAEEAVVECVYVSDVRSEPSKTYTFPVSRVRLIDVHHADSGLRIFERVAIEICEQLFGAAMDFEHTADVDDVSTLIAEAGFDEAVARAGSELAETARATALEPTDE